MDHRRERDGCRRHTEFRSNLLHPNPEIRSFLKPDNKGTTIVIAPKGFGKTLLLKAKRLSIQDKYTHILPSGALVEKPSGLPSVIPTSDYGDLRDSEGYWRSVWLLSFTIAVLKATDYEPGRCSRSLKAIFQDDNFLSVWEIFDHILSAPVNSYHQLNNDYNDALLPGFRRLHELTAVFVDNIDEYYEGVLREMNAGRERPAGGKVKRSFWHLAQYGIAAAARELSHINTHVKIYVSIRKEVLQGSSAIPTSVSSSAANRSSSATPTAISWRSSTRTSPILMPKTWPIRAPTTRYRRSSGR